MKWVTNALGITSEEEKQPEQPKSKSLKVQKAILIAKINKKREITQEDIQNFIDARGRLDEPATLRNGFTLLHIAVVYDNIKAIKMIMKNTGSSEPYHGLFPNREYGSALHLAANSNKSDAIRAILTSGEDALRRTRTISSNDALKKLALTYDSYGNIPFMSAVLSGHKEAMEAMVPLHAAYYAYTTNRQGVKEYHSAFKAAAQSLNPQEFYELFADHRNLNTKDFMGKTCLDYALDFQNIGAINYLKDHPHIRNLDNLKALVAMETKLKKSGDNPAFQEAVSNAITTLDSKNQQNPLPEVDYTDPSLYLERPAIVEVDQEPTAAAQREPSNFKESGTIDSDGSTEIDSDHSEEDPEKNAPKITLVETDVIDENHEENIEAREKEREKERKTAFAKWRAANPKAIAIFEQDREKELSKMEAARLEAQKLDVKVKKGVAKEIDNKHEARLASLKSDGKEDWGARLKSSGAGKIDKNGNFIR